LATIWLPREIAEQRRFGGNLSQFVAAGLLTRPTTGIRHTTKAGQAAEAFHAGLRSQAEIPERRAILDSFRDKIPDSEERAQICLILHPTPPVQNPSRNLRITKHNVLYVTLHY
jgi:hypothetical protein